MTAEIPKPAEIRRTKGYLWRRILCKWPLLVWIGMALLTYQLYQRGVRFERMNGLVAAETQTIAALQDGVIQSMSITANGETVAEDQLIVQMDPRLLQAELASLKQDMEFEKIDQERKFGTLKTDYVNDISRLKAERDGAIAQVAVLEGSLDSLRVAADNKSIPRRTYTERKTEFETLRATLPAYDSQIATLEAAITKVDGLIEKLKEFNQQDSAAAASLQEQIDAMQLKSISGGSVSQIFFGPGAAVKRGEPIATIINTKAITARGFIQEEDADKLDVGRKVFIRATGESEAIYYGATVTYISPHIISVADVGSSVSGRKIKGREITCSFDDSSSVKLLPGQSISIHLEKPGKFKLFDFGKK